MSNDFMELLVATKSPGRYQIRTFFLLAVNYFPIVFNNVSVTFLVVAPQHTCHADQRAEAGRQKMVAREDFACHTVFTASNGSNWTVPCGPGQFVYHYKDGVARETIVTRWDLVCGDERLADLSTTMYFCGVMAGGLVWGYLSDKLGRRPVLLINLYLPVPVGLVLAFSNTYSMYVLLRFILGFLMQGLQTATFVLAMELFLPQHRPVAAALLECVWGLGVMVVGALAYVLSSYRHLQIAISVPSVLVFFYICVLPESLRWLIIKGDNQRAEAELQNMVTANRAPYPQAAWDRVKGQMEEFKMACRQFNLLDLVRTPKVRQRSLTLFYLWLATSAGYYGITLRITSLAGDAHLNFFLGGVIELAAYLIAIVVFTKLGRKRPMITYALLGGVCSITAGAMPQTVTAGGLDLRLVTTGLALSARFALAGLFCALYLYTSELYPTVIRNLGLGACLFWARLGGVLAPQVNTVGHVHSTSVPIMIYGVLTAVCAPLLCRLPETSHSKLPDLISDVETSPVTAWPEGPPSSATVSPPPGIPPPQGPHPVAEATPDSQGKSTTEV